MKKFRKQTRQAFDSLPVSKENEIGLTGKNANTSKEFLKKAVIFMLLFIGSTTFSFAQFDWGVKLGANASTQSEIGNICDDNNLKIGLNAGMVARFRFNDWMAVISGLDYQNKGKQCDLKEDNTELTTNLKYLILPVKAEFSASEKAGFKNGQRLFFATGPYFGYLLDGTETKLGNTTNLEDLNDFDFGWSFELGFEFPVFKANALQVSLNYDMGVSDMATDLDVQNKSASINLGFLF
jgi:hypothetical protein